MLLSIENLTVQYLHGKKAVSAVRNVGLQIEKGSTVAVVGESGCGKSTLALAVMGLLPKDESRIESGSIFLDGKDMLTLDDEEKRLIRGRRIAMIFQDPFSALNPVLTAGRQLMESVILKEGREDQARALSLLKDVQLPDPERILTSYPHQLSGGQRQRILIAMALAGKPELLIADEPTTALDVTVQDEIMKLLALLQKEHRMSVLFITHNMGLVKGFADQMAVMYAGEIVEAGKTERLLTQPLHPYTRALLKSLPKLAAAPGPIPVIEGQPPDPLELPSGCPFHPRCEKAFAPCPTDDPAEKIHEGRTVRCHLY